MKTPADQSLFQRAEHALASLQHQEKAALFHAAANNLQLAMAEAESGDATKLNDWLQSHADLLDGSNSGSNTIVRSQKWNLQKQNDFGVATGQHEIRNNLLEHNLRIDLPIDSNTPMTFANATAVSPWIAMEQSATRRIESRLKTASTSFPSPAIKELDKKPVRQPEKNGIDISVPQTSKQPITRRPAQSLLTERIPVPDQCKVDAFNLQRNGEQNRSIWRKFASTHVWVSLLLHSIAIPILGYIVVSQVVKEKKLAIVSAAVESDAILTETALEMPSTMEADDLSAPLSDPIMPTLPSDVSLPEIAPIGALPTAASSSSKSIAQSLKSGNGTPTSNKLVMGAEFFGVKATGNTFVYIVDCSPSMKKDGAFDAAKQEIGRSLTSMKPTQRFYLMFFGKEIERLSIESGREEEYPIYATPANVQKAIEWLGRSVIQKEGWPPNDSLDKAIEMQPDGIFMLFDGDTRSDVAKHLTKVNRTTDILSEPGPKVPIHVIHFFQEEFATTMRKVANENGGSYRFVARPERNKSPKAIGK